MKFQSLLRSLLKIGRLVALPRPIRAPSAAADRTVSCIMLHEFSLRQVAVLPAKPGDVNVA